MYKWTGNHTYWNVKKITEARNRKSPSKFVREYGVLHFMLRNLMSLFIKNNSLYNPITFLATLYPTSLANLVVEVGIRHSHQTLLITTTSPRDRWVKLCFIYSVPRTLLEKLRKQKQKRPAEQQYRSGACKYHCYFSIWDCSISCALAMDIPQSYTKPSINSLNFVVQVHYSASVA